MKSESTIQSEIMLAISKAGHRVWRSNAGRIKTEYGGVVQLFPKGYPDLTGFRKEDGKYICIEVKDHKGKLGKEQKRFAKFAFNQNIIYGVCRSADEAMELINSGTNESTEEVRSELSE